MKTESIKTVSAYKLADYCIVWLKLIAIIHIVGGLALSFNWPEFLWSEYRQALLANFNITSLNDIGLESLINMLSRLLGPTVTSWGILMLFCVKRIKVKMPVNNGSYDGSYDEADRAVSHQTINFLALATLLWFSLDTSISLSFGMKLHAFINTGAAFCILLPLLLLRLKAKG